MTAKTLFQSTIDAVNEQLSSFYPLSKELKQELNRSYFEVSLKKNEFLMKSGEVSSSIYFIVSGTLTASVTLEKQKVTTFISISGDFLCAIEGMYGFVPCTEDVKAEEDSTLIALPAAELCRYFDVYPEMNIIMRKILELYYKTAHYRSVFFRVGSIADRYSYFENAYASHASKIPLEITASFLNVKIDTLQKIIKKKNPEYLGSKSLSMEAIISHIEQTQPFRQKKLTLFQLSAQYNVSAHTLSHLLNLYFNQNFNRFINSYRINYILNRLQTRTNLKQYSLDGLGTEAGFSSKSTFFREFKKHTGVTPHNYIDKMRFELNIK